MQRTDAGPACFPLAELRHAVDRGIAAWLDRTGSGADDSDHLATAQRWALCPPGKLLRPITLLAAAGAVGGSYDAVLPAAVGIELAHVATLVHDDIIDGDELRRGKAAAHREFGLAHGVLAADSLFFALFEQVGACRQAGVPANRVLDAVGVLGAAGQQTARGVAQEVALSGSLREVTSAADGGIAAYVEMARLKSASLFYSACHVGALLGGGSPEETRALAAYGEAMGIAFQIRDDLLPYVADGDAGDDGEGEDGDGDGELRAGKPVCSDLRNRRPALPVLLAHRLGGRAERAALVELVDGTTDERARQRQLSRLAHDTGALDAAQSMARAYVDRCREALAPVPAGTDRDRLAWLADEVAGATYGNGAAGTANGHETAGETYGHEAAGTAYGHGPGGDQP
ncbi:polyprenyl synthetase family protein [Streptomyces sp. CMB-StM0423]|uniref:polyprenyl synthetase family protein n=1 Tax=Streptomyces sp. CMB-StM0423 TaxID=2059884 RepID=UPI000C71565E|nr:polyprenyl synthetase family protein [Streptomyces sp. CMB-StM0423]AUH41709.1 polyprenyl synthetase family protein [Streptomyces sp. CMB-StM0423]